MTRVEKYRAYRKEISNMKFESFTSKSEASKQVDILHDNSLGNKLEYSQIMEVHEMFEGGTKKKKSKNLFYPTSFQIKYTIVALCIILIILITTILVDINLWG